MCWYQNRNSSFMWYRPWQSAPWTNGPDPGFRWSGAAAPGSPQNVLPARHHSDFKALRNLPNLDYFSKDNKDRLRIHVGSHGVNVITLLLNQHGSVWISNIWIKQFPVDYLTDERLGAAGCETLPSAGFTLSGVSLSRTFDWTLHVIGWCSLSPVIRPIWRLNESKCSSSCRLTLLLLLLLVFVLTACWHAF